MNWGYKLTIGMILFMGFIIFLAAKMMKSPTETVEEKYYEKGLHYTERLEMLRRGATHAPQIVLQGNQLKLKFTESVDSINIILVKPSDRRIEKPFPVYGQQDSCILDLDALESGRWKMTVEWKQNAERSALETDIVLP